ncbi:MAG: hypothetical protein PHG86_04855 [Candidatus Methanomethylophilaceae archaeon]|nr:hypothetical protein [Candidatus Methanomethylophilaceae archaeon]
MAINNKTMSAVLLGAAIIALAIGLIIYSVVRKDFFVIIWSFALIFGIAICITVSAYSNAEKHGPSEMMYRLSTGMVMVLIGIIGFINIFASIDALILIAIFLIGLAFIGITVAITNNKKVA